MLASRSPPSSDAWPGLAPPRDALARGDRSRPISGLGPSWPSNARGPGNQSTVRGARSTVLLQRPRSYLVSPSDGQVGVRAGVGTSSVEGSGLGCPSLDAWRPPSGEGPVRRRSRGRMRLIEDVRRRWLSSSGCFVGWRQE